MRSLFLAPACVHASFSAADEKIATGPYRRGVSMEQIARAILLGCARKYVAMLNAKVRTPITSLQYFSDIVGEVSEPGDTGKLLGTASHESDADGTTMAAGESSQTLMPQPVGQSPTAPLHRTNCPHPGMPAQIQRNACPHPAESTIAPPGKARNEMMSMNIYLPFS